MMEKSLFVKVEEPPVKHATAVTKKRQKKTTRVTRDSTLPFKRAKFR